jgi:hypothetical protein
MARVATYDRGALFGAGPVSSEFATGSANGFMPVVPTIPTAETPAAAAFTGLTFGGLVAGPSFWRSEAAGFIYFLALAVLLNRRIVNR